MKTIRDLLADGTITMETGVMGTLPMSGDGCIVGDFAYVHFLLRCKGIVREGVTTKGIRVVPAGVPHTMLTKCELCFRSREAAEKARGA